MALSAQGSNFVLELSQPDDGSRIPLQKPKSFADSISVLDYLRNVRMELIAEGYLAASFDGLVWQADTLRAELNAGERYRWAHLKAGNVREEILSRVGYRERFYADNVFKPAEISSLFESLLNHAENNGYPFAQIGLDSVNLLNDNIRASLRMDLAKYTVIDSIIIKGDLHTNRRVIENHLGLVKNAPYNQRTLSRIPNRLRELPYVRVIKPYEVGMRSGKADVYLYLDNRKASNFDGVLGILPNPVTGEVTVTGDVQLDLMNALKAGERINMRWQRLQTRTQQLDVAALYPFVFGTPLGAEFRINLFRQDTLFSQLNLHAGIPYFLKGSNHIKVYVEEMQANVISPSAYQLGRFVDSRSTLFGLGAVLSDLDYRFNPRKGYSLDAAVAAGTKRIQENTLAPEGFYDNLRLRSEVYNASALLRYFQPIARRATVMLRMRGGYFLNDNMFENEAYRIGGLRSLRGFDEQAIFATGFAIFTAEYRFLFEENSNLFLFFDQGMYENRLGSNTVRDTPFGFGGGINFETAAGIFSLTYALGRQFDNTIELRSGKLHFGFVNFF